VWYGSTPAVAAARDWVDGFGQLRDRLACWEKALDGLRADSAGERQRAAATVRRDLEYLKTVAIEHCRRAESVLAANALESPDPATRGQFSELRRYHERFGVDLDKFERQVASYELSGDPTVLLSVGSRIVREFTAHLAAEEALASALLTRERA
jgi:hypothetical protein